MKQFPKPPFPKQPQSLPGLTEKMNPRPDHGETSYTGSGKLAGKKAIITGGDSGIGLAVAIAYAREGADLLVVHLPSEGDDGSTCRRHIEEAGRKAVMAPGDISDAGFREQVVERAMSELGGVDILVNNAAYQKPFESIDEISLEEWNKTFDTNVHATFHLTQLVTRRMEPGGSIINTSSIAGHIGMPGASIYIASKHAVEGLTKTAALEFAKQGIRINAVAPGAIVTDMLSRFAGGETSDMANYLASLHPIGRLGKAIEIAEPVVWLASEASSFVTGQSIVVDGGFIAQ